MVPTLVPQRAMATTEILIQPVAEWAVAAVAAAALIAIQAGLRGMVETVALAAVAAAAGEGAFLAVVRETPAKVAMVGPVAVGW